MKKIFFLTILLAYFNLYSQSKSGKAIYSVKIQSDSLLKKTMSFRLREKYERAENEIKNLKLKLIFNDTISCFSIEKNTSVDLFALKITDCEKTFFTNLISNQVLFTVPERKGIFSKNEFLVQKKIENNWIFTNEVKFIQNFKCYKAYQEISIKNDEGTFYRTIIAWYCPEIPFTFGPKGYCDLPGLILELHDNNTVFGLTELSIYDNSLNIELPKKGEKIDYDKYLDILKERIMKRMELSEN